MSQPSQSFSTSAVSPKSSASPLIASDARSNDAQITVDAPADEQPEAKTGKRRFFGLGKKKEEKPTFSSPPTSTQPASPSNSTTAMPPRSPPATATHPISPGRATPDLGVPGAPSRHGYPSAVAVSPSRLRSSSPRLHSPASSEIFERNVQEPVPIATLQNESTPAHIPAHVMTEDMIPPALEASAQAITDTHLNPDEVEIVMSTSHQPAAASVLEGSASHADLTSLNSPLHKVRSDDSDLVSPLQHSAVLSPSAAEEDGASSYGQLDPTDVRRLSFISFADIVQSEHMPVPPMSALAAEIGSRDSLPLGSSVPSSLKDAAAASTTIEGRAASPRRGVTTPPLLASASLLHHGEQSPARSSATVGSGLPVQHGELTIETMRQAVRKTASGDLGAGGRATGGAMSPVSDEGLARSRPSA